MIRQSIIRCWSPPPATPTRAGTSSNSSALSRRQRRAAVLQFHGVPDIAHPWVHTPPENFRRYMEYLKQRDFQTLAIRDLERFVDRANLPDDPMLRTRYP